MRMNRAVTESQCEEIKRRYRKGRTGNRAQLAKEYGLAENEVYYIALGQVYGRPDEDEPKDAAE